MKKYYGNKLGETPLRVFYDATQEKHLLFHGTFYTFIKYQRIGG